jgi:ABC-type Fe3+ transport system substrate-binding protein
MPVDESGTVFFAGVCKLKDFPKGDYSSNLEAAQKNSWSTGYNTTIEGTNGFVYKMWTMIPKTARHPYTACLLIRYMLTQEGFETGWKDVGYYSANNKVVSSTAEMKDPSIAQWKSLCLIEDNAFIATNYSVMTRYIKTAKANAE